jgi:hypothetical protein
MRVTLAALLAAALVPVAALADACPLPALASPTLGARTDAERLRFLRTRLEDDAARARTWREAWVAAYTVGTLGQLVGAGAVAAADQPDWFLGAASTAVGAAFTLMGTPDVVVHAPGFSRRSQGSGPADCALLAEGEGLLERDAANETDGVRWYWHLASVVFNAGVSLIIGLAYGHWSSALLNFLVGAALGEGTLFTQPQGLVGAWDTYLAGGLGASGPSAGLRPRLVAGPLGLTLAF